MYVEFLTKHNYLRQTRMNKELQSTHTSHSPGALLTLAVPVTVSLTNVLFSLLFRLFAFSVEESGHSHQLHQWSPNLILGKKILHSVPVFSSVRPSNRNRARLGYGGQTQTIRGTMGALPPEEKCLVKVKCSMHPRYAEFWGTVRGVSLEDYTTAESWGCISILSRHSMFCHREGLNQCQSCGWMWNAEEYQWTCPWR